MQLTVDQVIIFHQKFLTLCFLFSKALLIFMDYEEIYINPHQLIKEDLQQSPHLRFYIQEQSFIWNPPSKQQLKLPFNLIVNETVCDLHNMSRTVANNSRLTNSFLQNGRDIYEKKMQYFTEFLKKYAIINLALACMTPQKRMVFVYSLMALSNLILKLSINMAKISMVTVSNLLCPSYLNIFTVSVLFQKYLEFSLLKAKQTSPIDKKEKEHLIKQFPKMTIFKLSKKRNLYDIKYLHKSQQLFDQEAKNIQLIQLYEQGTPDQQEINSYPRYQSININQTFGLTHPLGFQLYLFITQAIIPKMIQFKPDIIIFIEDYDSDCVVIQPRILGLILNQFSAKVQNKIYVFKQIGITEQIKNSILAAQNQLPQMIDNEQIKKTFIKIITCRSQNQDLSHRQLSYYQQIQDQIKRYQEQSSYIQTSCSKQLIQWKEQEYKTEKHQILAPIKKKQETAFTSIIKQIQKILLDNMLHISLAMIQKSSFQAVLQQYRNYRFSPQFLNKFLRWLQDVLQSLNKKQQGFSQNKEFIRKKIDKITGMLNLTNFVSRQSLPQATSRLRGFPFYNLYNNSIQYLIQLADQQYKPIHISTEDTFYVAYQIQFIIIFVFSFSKYSIYVRDLSQSHFTCQKQEQYTNTPFLQCKNSILVANDKYFYKAFGQFEQQGRNKQSLIYRICIQNPKQISCQSWQLMSKQCLLFLKQNNVNKGIKIPLQFKRHGFGYSYTVNEKQKSTNIIILAGGYNFKADNEQKINRFLYIIKNNGPEIYKVGKTNIDLVNEPQNLKSKNIIYPFVYGVPLQYQAGKQLAILNTNGYQQGLNHFKRLFLTRVQISSFNSPTSIGIIAQNKLQYGKDEVQRAIADKNLIISLLIKNYNRINRLEDRVVFNEGRETILVFKLQKHQQKQLDVFKLDSAMLDQQKHIQSHFSNKNLLLHPINLNPSFKK